VCVERDNLPKRMQNAVLSRLKLMAGVNIAEKRIPQDGRIKLEVDGVQIDYRVSSARRTTARAWCCVSCGPTRCGSAW
jgi:type II secretory ATPase GspE/PulE/Tfp pilus assembly ATPase PilB-like protein